MGAAEAANDGYSKLAPLLRHHPIPRQSKSQQIFTYAIAVVHHAAFTARHIEKLAPGLCHRARAAALGDYCGKLQLVEQIDFRDCVFAKQRS